MAMVKIFDIRGFFSSNFRLFVKKKKVERFRVYFREITDRAPTECGTLPNDMTCTNDNHCYCTGGKEIVVASKVNQPK